MMTNTAYDPRLLRQHPGNRTAFRTIPASIRLRLFFFQADETFCGLCQGAVGSFGP